MRAVLRIGIVAAWGAVASAALAAEGVRLRPEPPIYVDSKGATLSKPEGIACAGTSIVVADTGNGRLVRYELVDKVVSPRAEFVLPELPYPIRVQIDAEGNILALDGKSRRIARVGPDGSFKGFLSLDGADGPLVPRSLKVGADGAIYVLDVGSGRVLVAGSDGKVTRQIALPPEIRAASDVAVSPKGSVYVLDAVAARVYVAANGADKAQPFTAALHDAVDFPTSLALDGQGRMFVGDQNGGGIAVVAGDGSSGIRQAGYGWQQGDLRYPTALCVAGSDTLFVADRENNRIQLFQIVH